MDILKYKRIKAVLPCLKGYVLDLGCGQNELMSEYRARGENGLGIDITDFKGVDMVVDTKYLPFLENTFDMIVIMATLNHIPRNERNIILSEVGRVLKSDGRVIITMINPIIGFFYHLILGMFRIDFDMNKRGWNFGKGEDFGLWNRYIEDIMGKNGFYIGVHERFLFNLNNLMIYGKKEVKLKSELDNYKEQDEFHIQCDLAEYIRRQYPNLLWSATCGGMRVSVGVAVKNKRAGYQKGCADILIFKSNNLYHGLHIEMKAKEGVMSPEQRLWEIRATENGYLYRVAYDFDSAKAFIDSYIRG